MSVALFLKVQSTPLIPRKFRARLMKLAGLPIGQTTRIYEECFFGSAAITLGSRVFINARCFFDTSAHITIGDDVHIAPNVAIYTSTHETGPSRRRGGPTLAQPVTIGEGCWIGANAVILPGVTIAPGCIIAAGALVSKSTEPDGVYAGVPAKRIQELERDKGPQ